ncbi:MAG: 50S ribosomal protein L7ae-like protein, partial [Anaeroglobus sp.]
MSLESLRAARKTVGAKQTLKAMKRNEVSAIYIAKDSDEAVVRPLTDCAAQADILVDSTYTMEELG